MLAAMKREWRALKHGTPGRRFQERHARAQRSRASRLSRILRSLLGVLVAAAGIVLMPAPGPGWAVFILGLALVASDVRFVARALDWAELRARSAWHWARSH